MRSFEVRTNGEVLLCGLNLNVCNNSPSFSEYPAPYICAGQTYCYNNGAFDIDGDSLVYSLETPDNNNGGVSYLGAYSAQNPVAGSTNFDPLTGDLCMDATQAEVSVLAMKITEFRNGVEIGSVVRDIQVIVLNCLTTPPVLSGFNGTPANVTNSRAFTNKLKRFWGGYFFASSVTLTRFTSPSIGAACFITTTLEDSKELKLPIKRLIILCPTCSISLDLIAISSWTIRLTAT